MFILDVIPITKGVLREHLSYFSAKDIPTGSLVEIPLRKKIVKALIVGKKEVSDIKSEIRNADYSLKKIHSVKSDSFLPSVFIESFTETGHYFASSTGAVINSLFPKTILENLDKIKTPTILNKSKRNRHEKLVVQENEEERFSTYKSLIREEFAKSSSVLFIVPNIEEIKNATNILEKGIENYTFCLHNSLKKKDLIKLWNDISNENHPVLIIATPQFMSLPKPDINLFIIDKENSSAYKQLIRPYIDTRTFAEILSKKLGIRILFGDIILRTETLWREKNLEFSDITPLKFRSLSKAEQFLSGFSTEQDKKQKFSPLSAKLLELLERSQTNKESVFIFGSRRGYSPILQCNDCGQVIKCPNCTSPLVLHIETQKNRFVLCHKCNLKQKPNIKCENCQSWRLESLGIGLELIEESIKKKFPELNIFRIDKDTTRTKSRVESVIRQFRTTPGSILIGSEMALPYLNKGIDIVICGAIDSLFSIPDFRINEKIFSRLLKLRSLAQKDFLIQTKHKDLKMWQYLLEGNLTEFYKEEIEQRESLSFPPFSILIKITLQGHTKAVEEEAEKLQEIFIENNPAVYPSFVSKIKNRYIMNLLMKVSRDTWPDSQLIQKLRSLSPKFTVKIDPENIL